jgi:hypothetical protein
MLPDQRECTRRCGLTAAGVWLSPHGRMTAARRNAEGFLGMVTRLSALHPATRLALALGIALGAAGCLSSTAEQAPVPLVAPTAIDIAGAKPSGKVSISEVTVAGVGGGQGTLTFRGKTYPFKLASTVFGPGGVAKLQASGNIYKLADLSQFDGVWVQGTGPAGLQTSGRSELWLQNKAGVVMHLVGQNEGVTLSLGKDELLIELTQ